MAQILTNIHAKDDSALGEALNCGHLEVVKYLVEQGADIDAKKRTALENSAADGQLEMVKYLLEQGLAGEMEYVLYVSARMGHLKVVKYLVERGADIHALNESALRESVENGHLA